MKKHLIWDFDGTLYDTYPQMAQALLMALGDFSCQASKPEAYALIKVTVYHAITTYAGRFGLPVDELQARFYEHHRQQQAAFTPMSGMADCIRDTHGLGCKHYLFTHRNRRAIDQLTLDGLAAYFTDYVTQEDGFADKPAPDAILHLMATHGFAPSDAVMIGDRDIDILSGQAAGVEGILYDPEGFYPDLSVEARAHSMADITRLLAAQD